MAALLPGLPTWRYVVLRSLASKSIVTGFGQTESQRDSRKLCRRSPLRIVPAEVPQMNAHGAFVEVSFQATAKSRCLTHLALNATTRLNNWVVCMCFFSVCTVVGIKRMD